MRPIERILSALHGVEGSGPDYQALCPAHEDAKASLSLREADDGTVLVKCHAGCETTQVLGSIGLTMRDLFPNGTASGQKARGRIVATYDYTDEADDRLFQAVRLEPKDFRQRYYDPSHPKAKDNWVWSLKGVRRVLYRLPHVVEAAEAGRVVFIVEGEKDVDALERLGLVATCNPMGAGKWRAAYSESLVGAHAVILPDNDDPGRQHADKVARSLHGKAQSVRIVTLPGLPPKGDVSDWLAAGGTSDELKALAQGAELYEPPAEADDKEAVGKQGKSTQAQELIELAGRAHLFQTPAREAYATFPVQGHRETVPVHSKLFELWLRRVYFEQNRRPPSTQALADARSHLESCALFDGDTQPVYMRTGSHEGRIYIDLCNEAWECVEITPQGWQIIPEAPIPFVRRMGMQPLPSPVQGGSLAELLPFVNLANPDHAVLLYAWLVHALNPDNPQPVLVLTGEQGTGKSTVSKMIRSLIDPSVSPVRSEPRSEQDLVISAENGWLQAFENLSRVQPWLSNALCRLATGAGFATRKLYAGREEELFYARRPIILNGIDDLTTRPDLADRAITIFLARIPQSERRTERELWPAFEAARPGILGALFDAMVTALKGSPKTCPDELDRMADFIHWTIAAEPSFPAECADFLTTYLAVRRDAEEATIERDLVAMAVVRMLEKEGPWTGSMSDLGERLLAFVPNGGGRKPRDWPRNGKAMSARLRRIAPALRAVDIGVEDRGKDPVTRRALYRIDYLRAQSFDSFDASETPSEAEQEAKRDEASEADEASDDTDPSPIIQDETGLAMGLEADSEASKDVKDSDSPFVAGTIVEHRTDGWAGTVTAQRSGSQVGVLLFDTQISKMVPVGELTRLYGMVRAQTT